MIGIIQKNQAIFIGTQLGIDYLSDYQKYVLKTHGIDLDDFDKISDLEKSYYFGMFAQALGGTKSFKAKKKDFDKWLDKEMKNPLSATKQSALDYLKNRTFTDISGLGNRFSNNFSNRILTASVAKQNKLQKKIKKKTIQAVKDNSTVQELASELREMTEDWARDFSRISDYVLQEAYGFGRAQQIIEDYGEDVLVYKQTFPGVCKPCEKNYGTPGQKPVIYKLTDLLKNGNNIGRKEQLPVVGNAHPFARSILHPIPKNSVWDEDKNQFILKRNKKGVKRKSKVKITISE